MSFSSSIFHTVRFKILASIFVALSLSIGVAIFGIWKYETTQIIKVVHREAMSSGRTIERSLHASMLKNDREAIQESITEISQIVEPPSRISIVAPNGTISFSSDKKLIGQIIDRHKDPSCTICHQNKGEIPEINAIVIDSDFGPMLRNIINFANTPACSKCHSADINNLGILLYDAFLQDTYKMLQTVALRTIITGVVTFAVIMAVFLYLVNLLIHRPIQEITKGLNQVGEGNFQYWVELDNDDEFSEMADTYNVMSRAMGRYIDEIKQKNGEISIMYTVVQQMSRSIEWKEVKKIIVDLLANVFENQDNILITLNESKEGCCEVSWQNQDKNRLHNINYCVDADEFPSKLLSQQEFLQWYNGKHTSTVFENFGRKALVPLFYNKKQIGLMCISKLKGQEFSEAEKKMMPDLVRNVMDEF